MGSRHQRAAAVPPNLGAMPRQPQKKPPTAEGNNIKNRPALVDIGNRGNKHVTEKEKPPLQITRPVTRSFHAQLIRNAQINAEKKKQVEVENVDEGKRTTVKPKSVEVIDISSSSGSKKSWKKLPGLTSSLTARSKAACGISRKPAAVRDIDGPDAQDELAVMEYVEDLYTFYKQAEKENRPRTNYMTTQVEINIKMRSILIDWLVEVHQRFELLPETMFLAFYIVDKYLSADVVPRRELQLVGISAMLIACKYEEIWAPEVNDFICISDRAYTREQILVMEKRILEKLEWNLTVPTPYVFLVRYLKASEPDKLMEHMVFYLAELAMLHYLMLEFSPSIIAASAVYVARCTLSKGPEWDETLKWHTGLVESDIHECVKLLAGFQAGAGESKLKVVYRKYSNSQFGAVALLPAAEIIKP